MCLLPPLQDPPLFSYSFVGFNAQFMILTEYTREKEVRDLSRGISSSIYCICTELAAEVCMIPGRVVGTRVELMIVVAL